jgi:hypothetical protein
MNNINEKVDEDHWPRILQHFDLTDGPADTPTQPDEATIDTLRTLSAYRMEVNPPSSPMK